MVQPNVNINVRSNFRLGRIESSFATSALIGTASWGDLNIVRKFNSFRDIKGLFHSGTIVEGAQKFFDAGGRELTIVRIGDGDEEFASLNINGGGSPGINVKAKYKGTHGNDITVTVTSNIDTPANKDVRISNGIVVERYSSLADNEGIISVINNSSELVTATNVGSFIGNISETNLAGGNDGKASLTTEYAEVLQDKLWLEDFDYLVTPGNTSNSLHSDIGNLLDIRADEERKESVYLGGVEKFESESSMLARTYVNSNGSFWLVGTSLYNGDSNVEEDLDTNNYLDASYTACAYAGLLCRLPVNSGPTFKNIRVSTAKALGDPYYTSKEREALLSAGITIITRTLTNINGPYQAVTRNGDKDSWTFSADNVRKVNFIKSQLSELVKRYIGEPNDQTTRTSIRGTTEGFFEEQIGDRLIDGYNVEVNMGEHPKQVKINAEVILINEIHYIDVSLVLNI